MYVLKAGSTCPTVGVRLRMCLCGRVCAVTPFLGKRKRIIVITSDADILLHWLNQRRAKLTLSDIISQSR